MIKIESGKPRFAAVDTWMRAEVLADLFAVPVSPASQLGNRLANVFRAVQLVVPPSVSCVAFAALVLALAARHVLEGEVVQWLQHVAPRAAAHRIQRELCHEMSTVPS
jgi:hypothetical protein